MNLIWSDEAKEDLHGILLYIAEDDIDRAISFTIELENEAEKLIEYPRIGVKYSDLLGDDVRVLHHKNYTILYEIAGNEIHIHEVFNQAKITRRNIPTSK